MNPREDPLFGPKKQPNESSPSSIPVPYPTVGRVVHYTNLGDSEGRYPPEIQAAIITGVNEDGSVSLTIFYKTGIFMMPSVPFSQFPLVRGHWTYPPRV